MVTSHPTSSGRWRHTVPRLTGDVKRALSANNSDINTQRVANGSLITTLSAILVNQEKPATTRAFYPAPDCIRHADLNERIPGLTAHAPLIVASATHMRYAQQFSAGLNPRNWAILLPIYQLIVAVRPFYGILNPESKSRRDQIHDLQYL